MRTFLPVFMKIFLLIFIISSGRQAFAQANRTPAQNALTVQEKAKLNEWSIQQDLVYKRNYNLALSTAIKNNWPLVKKDIYGNTSVLAGLFPNGMPMYISSFNAVAAATIRTNQVYPGGSAGLNLTGKYYTIGIWDVGAVRTSHKEFGGRVTYKDTVRTIQSHPTHVAGTMIAAGKDPNAKGMAYEANLWAYSYDNDFAEMAAAAKNDLLISNHSYGIYSGWNKDGEEDVWYWMGDTAISETEDYFFGYYNDRAKALDEIVFNARNYLPVFAAGNDRDDSPALLNTKHKVFVNGNWVFSTKTRKSDNGYDCITSTGLAKNALTVGAVEKVGYYSAPSSVIMSSFSGWGPTDDGRIKPDLVGDGVGLYSTDYQSDSAYGYKNGTSMAAPSVSGSLLLIQQQYNINTGNFLSAAALKAVAIHTTDEAGPNPGPDYMFGWGLMNTQKAIEVINNEDGNHTIKNGIVFKNSYVDYALPSDGQSSYRITLVWTDPAGTVSAPALNNRTPKLVNDLDVRVFDPEDGETFYPWRLDPNNPAAAATKGDNFRDNVEVIDIPYMAASDYKVRVNHKGQLANNQSFTLIISKSPIKIPVLEIGASYPVPTCPGQQVEYYQMAPDDFFTKYVWSFPGGTPSSYVGKNPPKITYNSPGEYDVILIASNDNFTRNFRINKKTVIATTAPGTATVVQQCSTYDTYVYADTTGKFTIKTMNWSVNNTLVKTTNGLSSLGGEFLKNGDVVKAILFVSSPCASNYNIVTNSIVIKKPVAVIPQVSLSSNTRNFCDDSKIPLVANATNTTGEGLYKWHVDGFYIYGNHVNTFEYRPDASKKRVEIFCVYDAYTECSDRKSDTSETLVFTRIENMTPTLSISTPKIKICNGDWVEITGTTNVPEFGRQAMWYLNGQPYGEGFGIMGFTLKNGDKVYCKITSTNPCLSKSEIISNEITFIGTDMLFPTITVRPTKSSICEGDVVTFFTETTDRGPNPTYDWYYNGELVKSGTESTYANNALHHGDEIRCILNPNQCAYNDVAHSNLVVMSVRGMDDSKLSIVADDTTICSGTSATFTATLTRPGFLPTYNWRVNGQVVSSTENNSYTTDQLENGDVVDCYVSQSTNCLSLTPYSNPIKMTVFESGLPTVTIAPITPLCTGKSITFEATATLATPTSNYQWNVNGVMKQNIRSNQFTSTELQPGDFVNCIMFTHAECATSFSGASMYYQVSLKSGYQGDISIQKLGFSVCENEPVEFVLYGANHEPGSVYQWKVNNEIVETSDVRENFSTTDLKDKDIVSATFISSNECLDQKEYSSNEIPIEIIHASPTISIASTLMCQGKSITFYAISTDVPKGSLYYWKKNGSYEDTGEDSTYTPPYFNPGDKISCTLIPKACTEKEQYYSNEIIIEPAEIEPSVYIQAEGIICPGQFATFRSVTKDEGENPIYIWHLNGQQILSGNIPDLIISDFKDGDILTCTLISSEACGMGEAIISEQFVIQTATPVNINLNLTAKYPKVCEGQPQEFNTTTSVPQNQLTYQWAIDGIPVENAISSSFISGSLGADSKVSCTVQSNKVCIDAATSTKIVSSNVVEAVYPEIQIKSLSLQNCKGQEAEFSATVKDAGNAPVFEWFVNGNSVQKGTSNIFKSSQLNNEDTVTCYLIPKDICTQEPIIPSNELIVNIIETEASTIVVKKISTIICEDGLSEFQADATHTGANPVYEWSVNNIVVQSGDNYNFSTTTLKNADVVSCKLIRNDACAGQQSFESNKITIQTEPRRTPAVEIRTNQENYCNGTHIQLTVTPTLGGKTPMYSWYLNDSMVYYGDTNLLDLNTPIDGDIIYCVMNTNAECVTTNEVFSNDIVLKISDAVTPSVSISASNTVICEGGSVQFSAVAVHGGTNPAYEWKINGNTIQKNASNTFISASLKNGDIVHCVLESNESCTNNLTAVSNEIKIEIIAVQAPAISVAVSNNNSCQGETIRFTATYAHAEQAEFTWKVNGQEVKKGTENTFESNTLKNGDKVTCILEAVSSCNTGTVTSNEIEVQIIEPLLSTINIQADKIHICKGQIIHFTAEAIDAGVQPDFEWFVNNISVQKGKSASLNTSSLQDKDIVHCKLTADDPCIQNPVAISSASITINVADTISPVVNIQLDKNNICEGEVVNFTAISQHADNPTYQWYVNGQAVASETGEKFNTNQLKNGDVVHCVIESDGECANHKTAISNKITMIVNAVQAPTISVSVTNNNSCQGETIRFTATYAHAEQAEFTWKVNGQEVQKGTQNTFESNTLKNGDIVICEMKSVSICSAEPIVTLSNSVEVKTITNVSPSIKISADDTEICSGTSVNFTAAIANGGEHPVIIWQVNNIVAQTGPSTSFNTKTLQNGDIVTAILQSDAPCTAVAEVISLPVRISVIQALKPSVSISASNTSICSGTELAFTAIAENTYNTASFEWKVNGETVQLSASDVFKSNTLKDKDKISCTVHVSHECASTSNAVSNTVQIEIIEPIQPMVELKHQYDTICKDTKVKLELNMTNISSGTTYQWYKNGIAVGSEDKLAIENLSTGDEIWCSISTKAINCDMTMFAISDTFTANVYPETEFEVYQRGDTIFATAGYLAYNWYFNDRLIAKGVNHFIVPEFAGTYTVNITDPNGCAGISRTIDFVFTSIKNQANNIFRMYPNPTDGKIQIEFSNPQSGIISIYHINGQLILQPTEIHHLKNYSLDISNHPEGMYIISFEQPEYKWSEKIIKMK